MLHVWVTGYWYLGPDTSSSDFFCVCVCQKKLGLSGSRTTLLILMLSPSFCPPGSLFPFKRPLLPWPISCVAFHTFHLFVTPILPHNCIMYWEVLIHKRSLWYVAQVWHKACWCPWYQQKLICFDTFAELTFCVFFVCFFSTCNKYSFIDAPEIQMRTTGQEMCMGRPCNRKLMLE